MAQGARTSPNPRAIAQDTALRWTKDAPRHPLQTAPARSGRTDPAVRLSSVRPGDRLTVLATGYSRNEGRIGGGPRNCLGELVDDSTIAVDPRVIPIGSIVRIDGCIFKARDVGRSIVGKRIDRHFSSSRTANRYHRTVTVEVVSVGTHRYNAWYARRFGGRHHSGCS